MKDISFVSKSYMCSACGACVAICPNKAITMKKSSVGRLYANVGSGCVSCGLCVKACPSVSTEHRYEDYFSLNKLRTVVGRACSQSYVLNGQSGGAVTAILSYLFDSKKIDAALVCKPGPNGSGAPFVATDKEQLISCQKSSYTPVPLLTALNLLAAFSAVAIVGLPCHLSALSNVMKFKRLNVKYKLGLICDRNLCGAISNGIRKYLNVEGLITINWRDKNATGFTYYNAPVSIEQPNGDVRVLPSRIRQKLKSRLTAPRCLMCPDKLNISADIVFGDPWNISLEDYGGASLIIANTDSGLHILSESEKNNVLTFADIPSELLDTSQHISLRQHQVSLYKNILFRKNTRYSAVFNSYAPSHKFSVVEYLRATANVIRFYLLELLPEKIVTIYIAAIISIMNDKKYGNV